MPVINGTSASDTLTGSSVADTITGGLGDDSMSGLAGDDTFIIDQPANATAFDWIDGGDGYDTLKVTVANGVVAVRSLTNVEKIDGNGFAYWIAGSSGADYIDLSGTTLVGNYQWLDSSAGNDTVIGSAGNDIIDTQGGNDSVSGSAGNDLFRYRGTGGDTDYVDGGSGQDTIAALVANTQISLSGFMGIEVFSSGGFTGVEIRGTAGNDVLDFSGTTLVGNLPIYGLGGWDSIVGTSGADTIIGGLGRDTISAGAGNDRIISTRAIVVDDCLGVIDGGDGYDVLVASENNSGIVFGSLTSIEELSGGGFTQAAIWGVDAINETWDFTNIYLNGIAYLDAMAGDDSIIGSTGGDTFNCYSGNDTLNGGLGNDTFRYRAGDNGYDALIGGSGNDQIIAQAANVTIGLQSISGIETLSGGGFSGVTVQGSAGADSLDFSGMTVTGIAAFNAGDGNDTIVATAAADTILGGAGDDELTGGSGADNISGGDGQDTAVYSGVAADYTWTIGGMFVVQHVATGVTDTLSGVETLRFSDQVVSLPPPPAAISGTTGADTLTGGTLSEQINGLAGNDVLTGGDGADTLWGGLGADTMSGGAGNDVIWIDDGSATYFENIDGGAGADTITMAAVNGAIAVRLLTGIERIESSYAYWIGGSAGADYVDLSGTTLAGNFQWMDLGAGSDTVIGSAGNDIMIAWAGNDSLSGGGGNDTFRYQGSANDTDAVDGGAGQDTIVAIADYTVITLSSFAGIEVFSAGGFGHIAINGSAGNDYLDFTNVTLIGNLPISGQGGADTIIGSAGNDYIVGTLVDGGPGNDNISAATVTYANAPNGVTLNLWLTGGQYGWGTDTVDNVTNVIGSAYADNIYGDGANNKLEGGGGNDSLEGSAGNDTVDGGSGSDILGYDAATSGIEVHLDITTAQQVWVGSADVILNMENVAGSAHRDLIFGNGVANVLYGQNGDDDITGAGGDDELIGGDGADTFFYGGAANGFDAVNGGNSSDIAKATANATVIGLRSITALETITANGFTGVSIQGSAAGDALDFSAVTLIGIDRIDGADGADTLIGSMAADTLQGSAGDDSLVGGSGADVILYSGAANGADAVDGGGGSDTLIATAANTVIGLHSLTGVEAIDAGGFAGVSLAGGLAADLLDLTSVSLSGLALIDGGAGNDTIRTGASADTLAGSGGNDSLSAGDGDDVIRYTGSSNGADTVDGGLGTDTIIAAAANTTIGLRSLAGVEEISSGGFSGVKILGSGSGDTLNFGTVALSGIVQIDGGAGADTVTGSTAADVIIGSAGDDVLTGGDGDDVFGYSGASGGVDAVDGGAGADTLAATAANTVIGLKSVAGVEAISGGGFSGVTIAGSSAADTLDFSSVSLNDIVAIDVGDGDDVVTGGSGSDRILLGGGHDTLNGSGGADTFVLSAAGDSGTGGLADLIGDFTVGSDLIDLTALDADTATAGDQAFDFIGTATFSNVAGQLRIDTSDPATTIVLGDVDGDGLADFAIAVTGASTITAVDFLL